MAKCTTCSAPLPANTQVCSYCGVRNDIDIKGKIGFQVAEPHSSRTCPDCKISMETIKLEDADLAIERCQQCYGLFFDPSELETLLEKSVSTALDVNFDWLNNINKERFDGSKKIKYRPCPVCSVLMNRVAFARLSGIVVDRCTAHGAWLSGGALSHLLEWKKAGGQLLQDAKAKSTVVHAGPGNYRAPLQRERWDGPRPFGDDGIGNAIFTLRDLSGLLDLFT